MHGVCLAAVFVPRTEWDPRLILRVCLRMIVCLCPVVWAPVVVPVLVALGFSFFFLALFCEVGRWFACFVGPRSGLALERCPHH